MDRGLARIVATTSTQVSRELGNLYQMVGEHFRDEVELRQAIAAVIADIGLNILQPAFEADAAMEAEFEERIERLGRAT